MRDGWNQERAMPLDLTILVGTMTGNAQLVAQELELVLDDGETRVTTKLMDGLDASVLEGGGLFLVCTSTYGQGDVPDNAKALYASLLERFDAILAELGARRVGEILFHDASSGVLAEEAATEWIGPWADLARGEARTEA
jgi:MioC protein